MTRKAIALTALAVTLAILLVDETRMDRAVFMLLGVFWGLAMHWWLSEEPQR